MTNRREFLQSGMSVPAWPLALSGLLSAGASARLVQDGVTVQKAVFDDRYAEGRAFADAMTGFGVPASTLDNGDVTRIWDELDRLWRHTRAAVAGSTQHGPLFVLERLARERGMRVVLRVAHEVRNDGTLAHVMTGPSETVAMATQLAQQHVEWPLLMAAVLKHCRLDGRHPLEQTIVTRAPAPVLTRAGAPSGASGNVPHSVIHYYTPRAIQQGLGIAWDGPLFSWLIAPRP